MPESAKAAAESPKHASAPASAALTANGRPLVRLKAVCGTDDDSSPWITVLLPDED
jgi:hypothetical protein